MEESINKIVEECEKYRPKLIRICSLYFKNEPEYAEDCVQEAYAALVESLKKGTKISNYEGWLTKVAICQKNKVLINKSRYNECDFFGDSGKALFMENQLTCNPDFLNEMISDAEIEKVALEIILKLNDIDKYIYYEHYYKHRKLKTIARDLNMSDDAVWKRHERIKRKIKKLVKDFEKS